MTWCASDEAGGDGRKPLNPEGASSERTRSAINPYRQRVWELIRGLLAENAPYSAALDFGAGDGLFSYLLRRDSMASEVQAIDVKPRRKVHIPVALYDGQELPFPDRSFDLVLAVDVLHHTPNPDSTLRELLRCAGSSVIIKDHNYETAVDWIILAALDELGNRRFNVPSVRRYQRRFNWFSILEREGFSLRTLEFPARCHSGWLGAATNHLQFIGHWTRNTRLSTTVRSNS